jgi:hypothetical protein
MPADRELAHRVGHHDLRPPGGGVRRRDPPAHPRNPLSGAPHADGGPGGHARRHQAGAEPPCGPGPVPAMALGQSAGGRAGERLGHGGKRRDRGPGGEPRAGGHSRASRGRRPWPDPPGRADRGRSHQPDPVPHLHPLRCPPSPGGADRGHPLQDLGHRPDRPPAGDARAHPAGLRRAGGQPDGAAEPAGALRPLDLSLLRGCGWGRERSPAGRGPGGSRGAGGAGRGAGQLRGLGGGEPAVGAASHAGAPQQEAGHPVGGPAARRRGAGSRSVTSSSGARTRC